MAEFLTIVGRQGDHAINVVFIHGLGGHPYDTWRRGKGPAADDPTFWPLWLAEDIPGSVIHTIGYNATSFGWRGSTMAFEDRVRNLKMLLAVQGLDANVPLVLVCHSLGGLLVKAILLQLKDDAHEVAPAKAMLDSISGVVFLATPHNGAYHATLLDRLRLLLWPTALSTALVRDAPMLREKNTEYRSLAQRRMKVLRHCVLFETQPTVFGKIVREGSADPGLSDAPPVGIDENHIGIAKPHDRDALLYEQVRTFIAGLARVGGRGRRLRVVLNDYKGPRALDWLGLVFRGISLAALAAGVWFLWPRGDESACNGQRLDDVLKVVASFQTDEGRLEAFHTFCGRDQANERLALQSLPPPDRQADPALLASEIQTIAKLSAAAQDEAIAAAVASLPFKACGGVYDFRLNGYRLSCADGTPIPMSSSPNLGARLRSLEALVFHSTGASGLTSTLNVLTNPERRASAHLLVSREGAIIQLVPFDRQAWHAGQSSWPERNLVGMNAYSIGLEFENSGRLRRLEDGTFVNNLAQEIDPAQVFTLVTKDTLFPFGQRSEYWQSYTPVQIAIAAALTNTFRAIYPDVGVLGHADIARRKDDPGPAFPLSNLQDGRG